LLSVTAVLGVISVLWPGLGETDAKILASTAGADAASILVLCCTGPAVSPWHRAAQVTGILSACSGLVAGLYLIWSGTTAGGSLQEGILRAAAVLWILAVASAHTALMLHRRPRSRPGRIIVAGTVLCTGAAAELIANYALVPGFDPARGYLRALTVVLILDALGTILIVLTHRLGGSSPGATPPRRPTQNPAPSPSGVGLPASLPVEARIQGQAARSVVSASTRQAAGANGGPGGSPHQPRRKVPARSQAPVSGPPGWSSASRMSSVILASTDARTSPGVAPAGDR